MSDPRFTDPRLSDPVDPRFDPVMRRDESMGGMWGWVTGLAVLALIAFVVIAGWDNTGSQTASNNPTPPAATTGSAPMRDAPSTTGSGATSPRPAMPAPATPAPAPRQ